MNFFKKSLHRRKLKKVKDYARGADDTRKICEAEHRVEINRLRAKITQLENSNLEKTNTLIELKEYLNTDLGKWLEAVDDMFYEVQHNNAVKRVNTQTIHKRVDKIASQGIYRTHKLRKALTKVVPKVNAKINKVV